MVSLGSARWGQWSFCNRRGCLTLLKGGKIQEIELTGWLLLEISLLSMPGLAVATQRHLPTAWASVIYVNTFSLLK